ncbi:unnamed protein product [Echinostoma caproni]|uniref:Ig-like domain-containing protein n=1 Tax=Echinostoma caproni TaxID=27848 RepID=A0A183B908_9TREM|nr:unnamed protein product [Echinostoma caproni]
MDTFRLLYASQLRPRLEYGSAVTYCCTAGVLANLERVQRAATILDVELRGTSYEGYNSVSSCVSAPEGTFHLSEEDPEILGSDLQQYFLLRTEDRMRRHSLTLRKLQLVGLPLVYRLSTGSRTL